MYAAAMPTDWPGCTSSRRIGSVFVNGLIDRSTSIAPSNSGAGFARASSHDSAVGAQLEGPLIANQLKQKSSGTPAWVADDLVSSGEQTVTAAPVPWYANMNLYDRVCFADLVEVPLGVQLRALKVSESVSGRELSRPAWLSTGLGLARRSNDLEHACQCGHARDPWDSRNWRVR